MPRPRHGRHGEALPAEPGPAVTVRWYGIGIEAPRGRGLTLPELAAFTGHAAAEAARYGTDPAALEPQMVNHRNGGIRRVWVRIAPRRQQPLPGPEPAEPGG